MNIFKLTDVEIVYKIAEIKGVKLEMRSDVRQCVDNIYRTLGYMPYNPLHWGLNCMMRDDYKVVINYNVEQAQIIKKNHIFYVDFKKTGYDICRSVLLVIIAAHGEDES